MKTAQNTSGYPFDNLVFIGRFQPFHLGHLAVVEKALAQAETLIIVLGSAFKPRSNKNPFTAPEREAMIRLCLGDRASRVQFVAMRDFYDNDKWEAQVGLAVAGLTRPGARVGLIGHAKDETSSYLRSFPQWEKVEVGNHGNLNATDLRALYFGAECETKSPASWATRLPAPLRSLCHSLLGLARPLHFLGDTREARHALLATRVPTPVMAFLRAFVQLEDYWQLARSYAKVAAGKKAWAPAPYKPIFVTADAVICSRGRILLVRRKGDLGHGQWALPGGFLEQDETLLTAALRELEEETCIRLGRRHLQDHLVDQAVFDYPGRSERGRTVTHAFYFDLGDLQPEVQVTNETLDVGYFSGEDIVKMEEQIFEDHKEIIDRFRPLP